MVKTLTIRDNVYNKLLARKAKGESFSELFERLLEGSAVNAVDVLAELRDSKILGRFQVSHAFKDGYEKKRAKVK